MISNVDTICAIATPPGHGGLGVVRISGPQARGVLASIWSGKTPTSAFEPRRLYLGTMVDARGIPIDHALAVHMPAPQTYTGDEVIEISCHGSPVVLAAIVDACISAGSRLAEPGEFTRRAFLNGKIDLAQAEAVVDLISATSDTAARQARDQLEGRLSVEVKMLHDALTNLRAFVEATIDFPEEDIDMIDRHGVVQKLTPIEARIAQLLDTYTQGRLIRDGVKVAIVGRPNAGKSSLLNCLAGMERAIVHASPGTTRDVIEVSVSLGGIVFHLSDTAGIREAPGDVEKIGIERSYAAMASADVVLHVIDGTLPIHEDDRKLFSHLSPSRYLVCVNKADLPLQVTEGSIKANFISAHTGAGLEALTQELTAFAATKSSEGATATVTNLRHKEALVEAQHQLQHAKKAILNHDSAEFIAHHLRLAQEALGRIIGLDVTEAMLDRIFSLFCIGK
ncbi:MAG: tRNA uridine-5-carboxymethylaminomethyl(34) synthesis GTPase MnmE [Deltaproteobacteria bacterium]|nr:tRNA uridine-5-carboxymethylaminomethyl(34) synthesis GTPase MnmE [Deltaproteobacteria bacterium]